MESIKNKTALVSGASIAGFSTAWWLNKIGYRVTVVEIPTQPRVEGGAVNIEDSAVQVVERMGIIDQLKAQRLNVELVEFKNDRDITEGSIILTGDAAPQADEIEIERDKFIDIIYQDIKNDVEFLFNDRITELNETGDAMQVKFKNGAERAFDLVIGCDGSHSGVRKLWFGPEKDYEHFLKGYFSITIVDELLVKQKVMQMFNVPDKSVMLNAYNNKTDIIFSFYSEDQIPYDYRDIDQQRQIILDQFAGLSWRTRELLERVSNAPGFYFDKFCQIKMPSWTKGGVALVGDAGYCASPAAGKGASLSVIGAAALADALKKHNGNLEAAFDDYNSNLRPYVEEVQATAEYNVRENFIPRTEEAIRERNLRGF